MPDGIYSVPGGCDIIPGKYVYSYSTPAAATPAAAVAPTAAELATMSFVDHMMAIPLPDAPSVAPAATVAPPPTADPAPHNGYAEIMAIIQDPSKTMTDKAYEVRLVHDRERGLRHDTAAIRSGLRDVHRISA